MNKTHEIMKKPTKLLSIIAMMLLIVMISACEKFGKYEVEYEVTGDASFISFFGPDGEDNASSASTPWSYSFKTSNENQCISLRAGSGGSTVYCKVYLDGKQVLSASESGGLIAITGTYKISDF